MPFIHPKVIKSLTSEFLLLSYSPPRHTELPAERGWRFPHGNKVVFLVKKCSIWCVSLHKSERLFCNSFTACLHAFPGRASPGQAQSNNLIPGAFGGLIVHIKMGISIPASSLCSGAQNPKSGSRQKDGEEPLFKSLSWNKPTSSLLKAPACASSA